MLTKRKKNRRAKRAKESDREGQQGSLGGFLNDLRLSLLFFKQLNSFRTKLFSSLIKAYTPTVSANAGCKAKQNTHGTQPLRAPNVAFPTKQDLDDLFSFFAER